MFEGSPAFPACIRLSIWWLLAETQQFPSSRCFTSEVNRWVNLKISNMLGSAAEPTPSKTRGRSTKPQAGNDEEEVTYISDSAHTHRQTSPFGGVLKMDEVCCGVREEQQQQRCMYHSVPTSLGLLLWVPLLLQPFGVTLSHGVDDGDDEVADHDQHHLLKHPRQPVLILQIKGKLKSTTLIK